MLTTNEERFSIYEDNSKPFLVPRFNMRYAFPGNPLRNLVDVQHPFRLRNSRTILRRHNELAISRKRRELYSLQKGLLHAACRVHRVVRCHLRPDDHWPIPYHRGRLEGQSAHTARAPRYLLLPLQPAKICSRCVGSVALTVREAAGHNPGGGTLHS